MGTDAPPIACVPNKILYHARALPLPCAMTPGCQIVQVVTIIPHIMPVGAVVCKAWAPQAPDGLPLRPCLLLTNFLPFPVGSIWTVKKILMYLAMNMLLNRD